MIPIFSISINSSTTRQLLKTKKTGVVFDSFFPLIPRVSQSINHQVLFIFTLLTSVINVTTLNHITTAEKWLGYYNSLLASRLTCWPPPEHPPQEERVTFLKMSIKDHELITVEVVWWIHYTNFLPCLYVWAFPNWKNKMMGIRWQSRD